MRTKGFFSSVFSLIILMACNNLIDDPLETDPFIRDFSYSKCQNNLRTADTKEIIHIASLDNGQLLVEHSNVYFNCEPDAIMVAVKMDSLHHIRIEEDEVNPRANCICLRNLDYKIDGIKREAYTITFCQGSLEKLTTNLDFSFALDTLLYVPN